MAAEGVIMTYIFTGEEERDRTIILGTGAQGYIIPQNVTHLLFHESVTVIPEYLFYFHQHNIIVEVYCHVGVKIIERSAFWRCRCFKRLIIPGVEEVECYAFYYCHAVTDIECPKLERVGENAFRGCKSLSKINLSSAKVVERGALGRCEALTDVKFGNNLESIRRKAFCGCPSLERITIPLKDGFITHDDTFQACDKLEHVDLVEGAILHETAATLHLEEWRNDMIAEINSINQILPNADPGHCDDLGDGEDGEKAAVIRDWIVRVLRKVIQYKSLHCRLLSEAAATLQLVNLTSDIVTNNVLPCLQLPSYEFDGEGHEEE